MIELGVLEPGREGSHLLRRRAIRRGSRLGTVLFVLAVSLMLSGEAGPASAKLRVLASLPFSSGGQYAVDGDHAFVAEPGPGGNRISGYDLGTGHRLWRTTISARSTLVSLQPVDGVLMATMYAPDEDGDHTVALDGATGRLLWHNRYSMDMLLPGGRVLLAHAYAVDTGPAARQGLTLSEQLATSVEAVDLHSGAPRWSYALAPGCQHAATGQPGSETRLAVLCPGGDLRVVDLSTGRTLRTAQVPPAAPARGSSAPAPAGADPMSAGSGSDGTDPDGTDPDGADPGGTDSGGTDSGGAGSVETGPDGQGGADGLVLAPVLSAIGDRLLVGSDGNGAMRVIAYDSGTLRPLWTVNGTGMTYGTYPCAQLLCLSGDRGLTVLDPATGRERWHTPQHAAVEVPGSGLAPQLPAGIAGDVLVQPLGDSTGGLVAAGTGRALVDLDHWQSVTGGTRLPIFARWPEVPDGRVWFGVLDDRPLGLRTIGSAPDVLKGQCRASADYLICETLDEHLRVWRYYP